MKRFEIACASVIAGCAIVWFVLQSEVSKPEAIDFCESDHNYQRDSFIAKVKEDSKRSSKWPALRAKHLKTHGFCAYCGSHDHLQVHHIRAFHLHPELELDPINLITLCETQGTDHHLYIGHAGNFKNENPNVVQDCQANEDKLRSEGKWPIMCVNGVCK